MKKVSFLLVFAFFTSLCFGQGIYLKIAGAPSDGPLGSLIQGYSQGVSSPVTIGPTGVAVSRTSISDFNFLKVYSKISIFLLKAELQGQHFSTAEIDFYDKDKNLYLKIDLEEVYIESYQQSGSACNSSSSSGCALTESVSLIAGKITWTDIKSGTSTTVNQSTNALQ